MSDFPGDLTFVTRWAAPATLLGAGILLGLAVEALVLRRVQRVAIRRGWRAGLFLASAMRGLALPALTIGGAYAATFFVELRPTMALVEGGLEIGVILVGTVLVARFLGGLVGAYARRIEGLFPAPSLFVNLTKLFVFLVGVLIGLQSVGISITPILTALGVGGLAVALALQDTLSNLFAGLHIIATKQVKPGDFVKLESGERGRRPPGPALGLTAPGCGFQGRTLLTFSYEIDDGRDAPDVLARCRVDAGRPRTTITLMRTGPGTAEWRVGTPAPELAALFLALLEHEVDDRLKPHGAGPS